MDTPAQRLLPADSPALADLLRTGQVRRAQQAQAQAQARPSRPPLSIGVPGLDAALGGGLSRGQLHEIVAPPSAGGTALLRAALASALRAGELCALIDPADAFDPRGARAAGLDLRRLLWVRPATLPQALRAAEIALEARFALVALDLADASGPRAGQARQRAAAAAAQRERGVHLVRFGPPRKTERISASPWARLSRRAEQHGGALVVLARAPQAGAFAAATVELSRARARWVGSPGTAGRLLQAGCALGAVARSRRGPPSAPLLLQLPVLDEGAAEDYGAGPGEAE